MTLQQLKYVLALDLHRNFSRAAESMHVSQPTLTMQVRKLENEMGFNLFNRQASPLEPTLKGREVIRRAQRILSEASALHAYVQDLQNSLIGRFRVAIIPTLAPSLLPRFLPGFVASHPETELVISEMKTEDILSALLEERMDVGLCATPVETEGIREIPCFQEPFSAYGQEEDWPADGALDIANLATDRLLLLEEGHCFRDQALRVCGDRNARSKNDSGFSVTSGSLESLKGLVRAGLGYSLLPEMSIDPAADQPWTRPLIEPRPSREISIVCNEAFVREELLMRLQQAIQSSVPQAYREERFFRRIGWKSF